MNENNKIASLAIVVPCYNEQEVFSLTVNVLSQLLVKLINNGKINHKSYLLFIDDGSKDNTWNLIKQAATDNQHIRGIKLSRNKGHQIALLAGLSHADTDMTISIDADLQDDPLVIEKMVDLYYQGNEIVYGVRNSRETDSYFKRNTAQFFYRIMGAMGVEQVYNHADYRLLDRRALNALLQFNEANLYLRGLIPLIGFRSTNVYYERAKRAAGESKYPLKKMLSLAVNGITSLSSIPLRFIAYLGLFVFMISILAGIYVLIEKFRGETILGWTSLVIIIAALGGVQMLALGIIGEYIGKIYNEVKKRPKFFIEETAQHQESE